MYSSFNPDTYISIHAAREGGDPFYCLYVTTGVISIHAAREGGDRHLHDPYKLYHISIHAAREGGDRIAQGGLYQYRHFNPRRP